jgi:hypothetical protein
MSIENKLSVVDINNDVTILHLHESPECSLVFSRFLFFIYSGAVWLHREYVLELHKLAEKYMVKALSARTTLFMPIIILCPLKTNCPLLTSIMMSLSDSLSNRYSNDWVVLTFLHPSSAFPYIGSSEV